MSSRVQIVEDHEAHPFQWCDQPARLRLSPQLGLFVEPLGGPENIVDQFCERVWIIDQRLLLVDSTWRHYAIRDHQTIWSLEGSVLLQVLPERSLMIFQFEGMDLQVRDLESVAVVNHIPIQVYGSDRPWGTLPAPTGAATRKRWMWHFRMWI